MPVEIVELQFQGAQALAFLTQMQSRLNAIQAAANLNFGASGGLPGGGGGGGSRSPFGTYRLPANPASAAFAAATNGAAAGISSVAPSQATAAYLKANAGFGAAEGLLGLAGQVPGLNIVAAIAQKKLDALKEEAFQPLQATNSRLSAIYGDLATGGYVASDKEMEEAIARVERQERRRYEQNKRLAAQVFSSQRVGDALSYAMDKQF